MKMKYLTLIVLLSLLCSAAQSQMKQGYDQARQTAIQDFSKTKLYKEDSVFFVTLYDTLHKIEYDKTDAHHWKPFLAKTYSELIVFEILGYPEKYFLDTTKDLIHQKGIPHGFFEKNGKIFLWWDKHHTLTDSTIKTLDKYHLIVRGRGDDYFKIIGGTDDSKRGTDYYFCRSNLSVYKKKIAQVATEYRDPPNIRCKQ